MLSGTDIYMKRVYPNGRTEKFSARVWDKARYFEVQAHAAETDKDNPHTLKIIDKSEFIERK